MTCREFTNKIEGFTLAELSSHCRCGTARAPARTALRAPRCCSSGNALAGAMQALRSSTATIEAPAGVEHEVLRAFRQSCRDGSRRLRDAKHHSLLAFRLSRLLRMGSLCRGRCRTGHLRSVLGLVVLRSARESRPPHRATAKTDANPCRQLQRNYAAREQRSCRKCKLCGRSGRRAGWRAPLRAKHRERQAAVAGGHRLRLPISRGPERASAGLHSAHAVRSDKLLRRRRGCAHGVARN